MLLIPLPTVPKACFLFRDVQDHSGLFTLIAVTFAVTFRPFIRCLSTLYERLEHTSRLDMLLSRKVQELLGKLEKVCQGFTSVNNVRMYNREFAFIRGHFLTW
jgi:hypothetical protein